MTNQSLKLSIATVVIGVCISKITGWNIENYFAGVYVCGGAVFYALMKNDNDD